jgi:hypothetical protein
MNRELDRGPWTNAVQRNEIKRTNGSFIQSACVEYKGVIAFEFTFNDFWDKRTDGCILRASFVDYERFKQCDLGSKSGLDIQPIVV